MAHKNGFKALNYRLVIASLVIGLCHVIGYALWNRFKATSQDVADHHLTGEAITFYWLNFSCDCHTPLPPVYHTFKKDIKES
jgi:hypothetical protein